MTASVNEVFMSYFNCYSTIFVCSSSSLCSYSLLPALVGLYLNWAFDHSLNSLNVNKYPIKQAGFLFGLGVKNPPAMQERYSRHGFNPWVRKILWIEYWQPTLVFLPGVFHSQRSKAGYSPRSRRVRRDWVTEHTCKVGSIFGSVDAKYIYQRQIFPKVSLQRCHSYELNLG